MASDSLDETFIETTYEAILGKIAKLPQEKGSLRLGERVIKVWTPDDRFSGPIRLATERAEALSFDEIVVTVPLGCLKVVKDRGFTPRLPDRLLSAIDNISVGHLEKVCIPSIRILRH